MEGSKKTIEYQVKFTEIALADIARLDVKIKKRIFDKIKWVAENHDSITHHPLKHLPEDLKGLRKRREGDYRILYWSYPDKKVIVIYSVIHRKSEYEILR